MKRLKPNANIVYVFSVLDIACCKYHFQSRGPTTHSAGSGERAVQPLRVMFPNWECIVHFLSQQHITPTWTPNYIDWRALSLRENAGLEIRRASGVPMRNAEIERVYVVRACVSIMVSAYFALGEYLAP